MPITIVHGPPTAEENFRKRVAELGGTCLYGKWSGTHKPHHVRCANGHNCYPRPSDVQQGVGICRACAGNDPVTAERNFRKRVAELGGICLYDTWLGNRKPHHIQCANGHDCYPLPNSVQQGHGICRACAGKDPVTAERNFRNRIAELGGTCLYEKWRGKDKPHHVRCSQGHDCYPRPGGVRNGDGICRACAGKDPATAERNFRKRVAELGGTCLYEKWQGNRKPHHVRCSLGHDAYPMPSNVQRGRGICRACAGQDPVTAERNFRKRVAELGGTCLYDTWLGTVKPHHIRCANGHDCYPRPSDVQQGDGICRACAGNDPATAERNFRKRVVELGGTCLYEKWQGKDKLHHVRCVNGHDCYALPSHVRDGGGICRACAGQDHDVFYVVEDTVNGLVKFGITSGDPRDRLRFHARDGFTLVHRLTGGLSGMARDIETDIKRGLAMAEMLPVKGKEYFTSDALALVLDIADSWFTGQETETVTIEFDRMEMACQ